MTLVDEVVSGSAMPARTIRFSFDYISANAYVAWTQLPKLAEKYGFAVEPIPVLSAGLLGAHGQLGPAEVRPKSLWMGKNNFRKARLLGVPLNPPAFHPFNPHRQPHGGLMRSSLIRWTVTATILACPLTAGAGTLTTPLMPTDPATNDRNVECIVTNVGNRAAEVAIIAKDKSGATRNSVIGPCPSTLDAGKTCIEDYGSGISAWCSFKVKGKVKASIVVVQQADGDVVSSLPATK